MLLVQQYLTLWHISPSTANRIRPNTYPDWKLEVGVICPTGKEKGLRCNLGPISLTIQSIDNIVMTDYDILIIAVDGLPSNKNKISYMISRARYVRKIHSGNYLYCKFI